MPSVLNSFHRPCKPVENISESIYKHKRVCSISDRWRKPKWLWTSFLGQVWKQFWRSNYDCSLGDRIVRNLDQNHTWMLSRYFDRIWNSTVILGILVQTSSKFKYQPNGEIVTNASKFTKSFWWTWRVGYFWSYLTGLHYFLEFWHFRFDQLGQNKWAQDYLQLL